MKKPTLKRYLISFGVAFVLTFLVLLAMGGLKSGIGAQWRLKHISDACFTVGALMFGIGILMWASGEGMFDMLSYSQQKQDQELTVAQTMNSLLPNSD